MKAIRGFDEFIKERIVKKQGINKSRAEFLIKESENSHNSLSDMIVKFKVDETNANIFVKVCYDILMELIRAKMLLEGYNTSGFGAHEAEVSYMRILGFDEKDVQFTDQLRFFRNGTLYYGTMLDKEYAEKAIAFTKKLYPQIKKMVI